MSSVIVLYMGYERPSSMSAIVEEALTWIELPFPQHYFSMLDYGSNRKVL